MVVAATGGNLPAACLEHSIPTSDGFQVGGAHRSIPNLNQVVIHQVQVVLKTKVRLVRVIDADQSAILMSFPENSLHFFRSIRDKTSLVGLFEPQEVAVTLVVRPLLPRDYREPFDFRKRRALDRLVVVGDGYEVQPMNVGVFS